MISVKCISGLLLSSFLLFFWNGNAQEKIKMPLKVSYCDEDTGVVFRPEISVFRKVLVKKNTNPVYGTSICYTGSLSGCVADIYIYALNTEPSVIHRNEFQNHYKEMLRQISSQNRQKHEIQNFELNDELKMTDNKTIFAYLAKFTFTLDEENYSSFLLMIPCGTRIVKVRVSMSSESPESVNYANEFITEICKLYIKNNKAAFISMKSAESVKGKRL